MDKYNEYCNTAIIPQYYLEVLKFLLPFSTKLMQKGQINIKKLGSRKKASMTIMVKLAKKKLQDGGRHSAL